MKLSGKKIGLGLAAIGVVGGVFAGNALQASASAVSADCPESQASQIVPLGPLGSPEYAGRDGFKLHHESETACYYTFVYVRGFGDGTETVTPSGPDEFAVFRKS
jgi:hypothetical protein